MASIDKVQGKRGTSWKARIRRKGMRTLSRSFKTKSNAEKWARQTEAEIDQKGVRDITQEAKISFGQALHDHIEIEHRECQRQATSDKRKKTCAKKYRGMTDKLNILKTDFEQFNTPLYKIRSADLSKWRDETLKFRQPSTIRNYYSLISNMYKRAISDWGMDGLTNIAMQSNRPAPKKASLFRMSAQDKATIIEECGKDGRIWFRAMVEWQMWVGLRASETASITAEDLDLKSRLLRMNENKTDFPRPIPLSSKAIKILRSFEWGNPRVFHVAENTMSTEWIIFRNKLITEGKISHPIKLHDLRHEATSAYFEMKRKDGSPLMQIHHVRQITGHKSLDVMFNIYANQLDPNSVVNIPGF